MKIPTWFKVAGLLLVSGGVGLAQPAILIQPQNQTNRLGTTAIFTVVATGAPPLSYQWRSHANATSFTNIPSGTNATLELPDVQPTTRRFGVVVTAADGLSTTSSPLVTLTVLVPPTITAHPTNRTIEIGETATFIGGATGTAPLAYQWRWNEVDLQGQTATTLVVTNAQLANAGAYTLVVTNAVGVATSTVALLTVLRPAFTKIVSGEIVNGNANSYSCAWGDYDNDGRVDLFVPNFLGQSNFLYRNVGTGAFVKVINPGVGMIANDTAWSRSAVWGDYDSDGYLDLFVSNANQTNHLYRNNGDGTFARSRSGSHPTLSLGDSYGAAWGDYDNDGHLDLFVANFNQDNFLYRNHGDGTFTRVTNSSAGTITRDGGASVGCAWGDYNNDGYLDLFVANQSGQNNFLYRNNGDGTFTKVTAGRIVTDGGSSEGPIWGDYDNDGFLDLYVTNPGERNFLYHNNRDGTFNRVTNSAVGSIVEDIGPSGGCAWADYDNDGFLDLFVANLNQRSWLYHNNGDGTFSKITSGNLVNDVVGSAGCGWADYDNNGFPDLFIANGWEVARQNCSLYRNNGNSNAWINIRCIGTVSNPSAIGAKVRVTAFFRGALRQQMREISCGSGYLSQNELRASFGLGEATRITSVRIEWPSGIVQDLHDVAVNQFLTVTEPPLLRVSGTAPDGSFELSLTARPSLVYDVETSVDLTAWTRWLVVTNTAGETILRDPPTNRLSQRFYRLLVSPH